MDKTVKKATAGLVAVAIVTAFGLHAAGLAKLAASWGGAGSQVLGTAETG
jgi:hypothetical protein